MVKMGIIYSIVVVSFLSLLISVDYAYSQGTIATTDKLIYLDGENVIVSGVVSKFKSYPVSIEIRDPTDDSINTIPVIPGYWSDYRLIIETGGQFWQHDGIYTVIVTHASIPQSEVVTFEYLHKIPEPIPPRAGALGADHATATLKVRVYDDLFNFTKPEFQMQNYWIRFEDGQTIHRYSTGVTLDYLFETLGFSEKNSCYEFQSGKEYCNNAYYNFKFYINDNQITETAFRQYVIEEGDNLEIVYDDEFIEETPELVIPKWVREVAGFWCNYEIDDVSFIGGVQFLIEEKIIMVPVIETTDETSQEIPYWIRTNACWWSDDQITDNDFASGLEFLIKNNVIVI